MANAIDAAIATNIIQRRPNALDFHHTDAQMSISGTAYRHILVKRDGGLGVVNIAADIVEINRTHHINSRS